MMQKDRSATATARRRKRTAATMWARQPVPAAYHHQHHYHLYHHRAMDIMSLMATMLQQEANGGIDDRTLMIMMNKKGDNGQPCDMRTAWMAAPSNRF